MRLLWAGALLLAISLTSIAAPPSPTVDKAKLENYIRYAEGFVPSVKMQIGDPQPTPLAGYFRIITHLSMGSTKQEKTYFLTADGQHLLTGPVWDLQASPFADTLQHLTTNGPSYGPADAKIQIVVFSDFQCPYCREFARTLREKVPQKYPKEVEVVFKDFPIDSLHPWARAAAEAGHCVGDGQVGAFWAYHDWIFAHQEEINGNNLREKTLTFAREQKLDPAKIASCLDTHATAPEVEANLKEGRALDIQQTPTFFLNGRSVPGAVPWASLDTLLQMELNRPASIPPAQLGK